MTTDTISPKLIAADQAGVDDYIERNHETINRALEAGYASLDAGESIEITSLEELLNVLGLKRRNRGCGILAP